MCRCLAIVIEGRMAGGRFERADGGSLRGGAYGMVVRGNGAGDGGRLDELRPGPHQGEHLHAPAPRRP